MKKLLQKIFSVKNEEMHKVITIFGLKFKFRNFRKEYAKFKMDYIAEMHSIKEQQKKLSCKQDEIISKQSELHSKQNEFYSLHSEMNCQQKELYQKVVRVTPMAKLRNFEVHLTEHCNLNCQCCNHYSPLAEPEFLDIEHLKKDFRRMAELTQGQVEYINLLGGEPLLHPNLIDFFSVVRNLFPNTKLNLITNGTLLNQQNQEFWDACRENKVVLGITHYPIKIDMQNIKETAKKNGIKIDVWGLENGPIKHSWFFPINLDGKLDARENFINCRDAHNCIFLRDGKLFTCVVPPNIHHFNKYFGKDVKVSENDYIDIYKVKSVDEILDFLAKPIPFCSYCNVKDRRYDLPWKISCKDIHEWVCK